MLRTLVRPCTHILNIKAQISLCCGCLQRAGIFVSCVFLIVPFHAPSRGRLICGANNSALIHACARALSVVGLCANTDNETRQKKPGGKITTAGTCSSGLRCNWLRMRLRSPAQQMFTRAADYVRQCLRLSGRKSTIQCYLYVCCYSISLCRRAYCVKSEIINTNCIRKWGSVWCHKSVRTLVLGGQ